VSADERNTAGIKADVRLTAPEDSRVLDEQLAGGPGPDETGRLERQLVGRTMQMHEYRQENEFMKHERNRLKERLSRVVRERDQLREAANAVRDCRNVDGLEDHFEFALDELEKLAAVSSAGPAASEDTR
jgi:hypothetical protein